MSCTNAEKILETGPNGMMCCSECYRAMCEYKKNLNEEKSKKAEDSYFGLSFDEYWKFFLNGEV